jgi:alcohol dehydrogenase
MEQRKFVVPEVITGFGTIEMAGRYLKHFGSKKTMIVTDEVVRKQPWFSHILANISTAGIHFTIFDEITPNPKDFEAMLGAELFLAEECDSILAIGGGSPMDCAKCISIVSTNGGHILDYVGVDEIRLPGPPLICIPSTAGTAADVSQFAIITDTETHIKKAIISKKVVPDLALIDTIPLITMSPYLTACTGMDALTHAIEAYVSNAASALTDVHAIQAIALIKNALPKAMGEERTDETMAALLMGSLHAGFAFSNASLGAVHAMAHSLGGTLDLPHGECNSIILEHIVQFNFDASVKKYSDIAVAMGVDITGKTDLEIKDELVNALSDLRRALLIPDFIDATLTESALEAMCHSALNDPCMVTNPKPMCYEEVKNQYVQLFKTP